MEIKSIIGIDMDERDLKCCGNCENLSIKNSKCNYTNKYTLPYYSCNNWRWDSFYINRRIILKENYEKETCIFDIFDNDSNYIATFRSIKKAIEYCNSNNINLEHIQRNYNQEIIEKINDKKQNT